MWKCYALLTALDGRVALGLARGYEFLPPHRDVQV